MPEWAAECMRNPAKIGFEKPFQSVPDYDVEMVIIPRPEYDGYRATIAMLEADKAMLTSEINKLRNSWYAPKTIGNGRLS